LGVYANAALVGSPAGPAPYNGSKGNWRFDNIVFHGTPTLTSNVEYLRLDNDGQTLDIWNSASDAGTPNQQMPASEIGGLDFAGPAGADEVILDLSNGNPLPDGPLNFTGGSGQNTIDIIGTTGNDTATVNGSTITVNSTADGTDTVSYTGANTIVFNGDGGSDTLTQTAQPGNGATLSFVNPTASDTLNVNGGTFTVPASAPGGGHLSYTLGTLSIGLGAKVAMALSDTPADQTTMTVSSLSDAGTLDITNNTVVVNYGVGNPAPTAAIRLLIQSGYNNAAFNGIGITSSKVASVNAAHNNTHLYAVAYANASDTAVANDHFTPGTIVIEPALVGDSNLDGKVSFPDFQLLSASFNQPNTSWDQGNFNYGPSTNFGEFQLLSSNFNNSTPLDSAVEVSSDSGLTDSADVVSTAPATPAPTPSAKSSSKTAIAAVAASVSSISGGVEFSETPITESLLGGD
jgi:hypothetical protein